MDQVFYVMAILGCGDGGSACTEARRVETRYETMAECRANLPGELARNTDLSFPEVAATCRRNGALIAAAPRRTPRG